MAIIRIKRTTSSNLPTGLTFGEMAFVQGGGYTANRLYIADNAGVCIWIGGQIVNSPTYWSGMTAETTVPTVSALESRVVAGGGLTFASNLNVNIDVGKYFGKYKKGDVIPAQGQTVKWVIEDALSETITPGVSLSRSASSVPFGQTSSISYTLTPRYQIKTIGATAAGATMEWRRTGDSGWTAYSGVFYDNTEPWGGTNGTTFDVAAVSGITLNGLYDTRTFEYRYTVHDTAGASASVTTTVSVASYTNNTVTSFVSAGSVSTPETNAIREKGNIASTLSGTINRQNTYVPLTYWKLQFSENGGAYADTNQPSAGWQAVSGNPSTVSISGVNHSPTNTINRVDYRVVVRDAYRDRLDSNGVNLTPSGQPGVSFGYKIFYGATATIPTSSSEVRTLPGVCMASGTNAFPNPFILNSGTTYKDFVVAVPDNIVISTQEDLDALNASPGYALSGSLTSVNDAASNAKDYNVYTLTNAVPYDSNHRHRITTTGTVA
jgi:hypothetical protein